MPGVIATIPKYQFSDSTGTPLAGGTLTTYVAGTTTLTNTWQDSALTTANTNPITLDSRGECVLWLSSTVSYKFVLKNAAGVTQWTVDNIAGNDASQIAYLASGTGAVSRSVQAKLRETVSPGDFGAVGDGATDDTLALQRFFDAVTSGGLTGTMSGGTYKITSPVTISVGTKTFAINGGSSTLSVASTFSGGTSAVKIVGSAVACDWSLSGITVSGTLGATGTATEGITIGSTTVAINLFGYRFSRIEQVHVAGFATNWKIVHARMIEFVACSAWNTSVSATNQTNLLITQAGAFTGDLRFTNCQYVQAKLSGNTNLSITSPTGPYSNVTGFGNVAGIKFLGCDFYAGEKAIYLYATSAAYLTDIWFVGGCQIDQETTNAIWVESNNVNTSIEDIHFESVYVDKSTSSQITLTSTGTGGNVQSVWISQCSLWRGQSFAVNLVGAGIKGTHILSNEIIDCAGAIALEVAGAVATRIRGNRHRTGLLNQKPNYLVQVESGSTDFEVTGNSGTVNTAIVNDLSGNITSKTIDLNPGYNPRPQASITVTASPFSYTNYSGSPQFVSIGGGTVSAITVDGLAITPTTNLFVPVPAGKVLTVTYTVAPTLFAVGY